MTNDEYRRRALLALSILSNADELGAQRALSEALLALEGATITDLMGLRSLDQCHGPLNPGTYCAECGTYNPNEWIA